MSNFSLNSCKRLGLSQAVAITKGWPLYQIDLLHGNLIEETFIPTEFYPEARSKGMIFILLKSLYSLKQVFRQWFSKLSDTHINFGFHVSINDHFLFNFESDTDFIATLVYVYDVIITGTSSTLISRVKEFIHSKFQIKNLGHLHNFLGIEVVRSPTGLF